MRKVIALKLEYSYVVAPESQDKLDHFYDWLINKAIDNLLARQSEVDNKSTEKYSIENDKSGNLSNPGGSGGTTKGEGNHDLPNVPRRNTTSGQIWQSLADRQRKVERGFGG